MIPAIVLVGGLGTRLGDLAGGLPKPMVLVDGRPFLQFVLDQLVDAGCARIILAVSHRREAITNHFGGQYRNVPISYSVEEVPLGTGGALALAFRNAVLDRALVVNGDTLFRVNLADLLALHDSARADVTLALRFVGDASRYGAVERDSSARVLAFREKGVSGPGLVNGGIYAVERRVVDQLPEDVPVSFENDVLQARLATLRLFGFSDAGYFIDIGVPDDLARARRELAGN